MDHDLVASVVFDDHDLQQLAAARWTQAVIVLLARRLMAFIGATLAVAGAPLMIVGVGIPLWAIGMALLLAAVDGDR